MTLSKWGGAASLALAVAYLVPSFVYLTGDLHTALGPLSYGVADFLYGPVWAVSLVTAFGALRAQIGAGTPQRMTWATSATLFAAAMMIVVACIRSANRHYHLAHPELHLEDSATILVVWSTILSGLTGAAWHFLGWSFVLLGSAGWVTRRLPPALSILYLVTGVSAWWVYVIPDLEGGVVILGVVVSLGQGAYLLGVQPHANHVSAQVIA
jgi:hypothetical protein